MKRKAPDMKYNTMESGKSLEILNDSPAKKILEDTTMEATELQGGTPEEKYKILGWNFFISENKAKIFRCVLDKDLVTYELSFMTPHAIS